MKGTEILLIQLMDGSDKRFIIPVYQRPYSWKIENCKQLFDDLIKVIKNNNDTHFFGSIVSSLTSGKGGKQEFLIIDGQQRLTTISLLILAMYNLIDENKIIPENEQLQQKLYENFLVDKFQPKETRLKLKHVMDDNLAFQKLFDDESEYINESQITQNYNYFYNRIQKKEITIDELYDAVTCLQIISITLDNNDDPQLIFESLNSTGLALTEGDKIRNYVLMGLGNKQQEEYYEKYWKKIETLTKDSVSLFVRDYLSLKQQSIPALDKVYITFKRYVSENQIPIEELLIDLVTYAKHYSKLLNGDTEDKQLNSCIGRLNRLETTVTRTFFIEVLQMLDTCKLSIEDVREIFLLSENYIFRRFICDLPTNSLNKVFLTLNKDIISYDKTSENYVDKFKYTLASKKERSRFPSDKEFKDAISTKQIYLMNSKNKIYALERFENYGTLETKDVWGHIEDGEYSIEHIMPQTLTPIWIQSLGDDYENIHEVWLHRLANLTLTAYNSKYSNEFFDKKRDMLNGFKESGIKMNQLIAQKDSWGLAELEERSEVMANKALDIWKYPVSDFKPAVKQFDSFMLDDDESFMGKSIVKFSYKDIEQTVSTWIEMYVRVIKMLHSDDKSVLLKIASDSDDSGNLGSYFSQNPNQLKNPIEIENGLFAESKISTELKRNILKKLFVLYDREPEDLVFYLKDDTENNQNSSNVLFEKRKRYWTVALEEIHKKFEDSNGSYPYSNVNPSTESWLDGYFKNGLTGVHIICRATISYVGVDLYIGDSRKEINKKIFDYLYTKKQEIESSLQISLNWERGDNQKSSKVYIKNDELSLSNDEDWKLMSEYHALWVKKFYDVFARYLKDFLTQIDLK